MQRGIVRIGISFGPGFMRGFGWKRSRRRTRKVKPVNPPIPAGSYRFRPDEPEHDANPARSLPGKPKHAQNRFCGLRRRFRRALKGDKVRFSCRLFHVKHSQSAPQLHVPPEQIFDRIARSARGFESLAVREDAVYYSASRWRVMCPMRD